MNTSRRRFLQSSGALVIAFNLPAAIGPAVAADEKSFAPNAYIRVDPNGRVTMIVAYVETQSGDGSIMWGVGRHESILTASLRAIVSAVNRRRRSEKVIEPHRPY